MGGGSTSTTISRNSSSYIKAVFGAIAMGSFIWLLVIGTSLEFEEDSTAAKLGSESGDGRGNLRQAEVVIGKDELVHPQLDYLNFMSKRRVPNGPDPIHNRRAGNSGRPPSHA